MVTNLQCPAYDTIVRTCEDCGRVATANEIGLWEEDGGCQVAACLDVTTCQQRAAARRN